MIKMIKAFLVEEFGHESWEDFINSQEMGECQSIVSFIAQEFKQARQVFGEIRVDEPSIYEEGGELIENYYFTHHWVEIDGNIFDFSKGTLQDNIEWADVYDIEQNEEVLRYNPISRG